MEVFSPGHRGSRRHAAGIAAAAALIMAAPAFAQGVDRSALEALFGEPVTTSATGKPQRAADVPVAMDIITAEQIRHSGAHDIPTVLARYTSLDVQQYSQHDFSVAARGYGIPGTPRLLVLVDGRQVYLDDYGRTAWHLIPVQLAEIRQIEVVKGPNSALFGFNAVGGVVNIITYDPGREAVSSLVLRSGTGGYREAAGVVSAALAPGSGVRLSGGIREERSWDHGYAPIDTYLGIKSEPSRYQFAGNGTFRLLDTVQASFDASYARSITSDLNVPGNFLPWDMRSWSLRGRITADTEQGILEASIYHNGLQTLLANSPGPTQGVTVVQLSDTVKMTASHTVRPFLEYRHNALENGATYLNRNTAGSTAPGVKAQHIAYDVAAAGMMWNWALWPGLEWTNAARYDRIWLGGDGYDSLIFPYGDWDYQRSFGGLSWNTGLVWRATDVDTIRASAARGVSSPGLLELGARVIIPGLGALVGSPLLKPTTVDNYEIGYSRSLETIDGRVGVTGFYQTSRDLTASFGSSPSFSQSLDFTPTVIPQNVGSSRAYGMEVSLAGQLTGRLRLGTEYRLAMVESPETASMVNFRHASPKQLLSACLGWQTEALRVDLFGRYSTTVSGYRVGGASVEYVTVDDYASVSMRVGYRIAEGMTVALEGSNLLHERQRQSVGLEAERQVYLSLSAAF